MRYARGFIAAILFAATVGAQQSPDAANFRVEGTVVDAETGQPIGDARLYIGAGPICQARTEGSGFSAYDGSFRIQLKTGGAQVVCVTREGYIPARDLSLQQCSPCTETIRLHAESSVSGRVLSADTKEPVARLLVEAIRVTDSFNIATSVTTTSARTFADGGFSLDQLTPGQYFFRFTPATHPPLLIDDARDASRELQMQWWPGGDTPRNATPFTVMAGTKFRLPDIWMPSLPRFQVSGTIGPAICKPGDAYTVSIGEKHGSKIAVLRSTVVRCGTEFLLGDLAPGRYEISLLPQDGGDPVAHEDVIVTDRNLQRDFPPAQATP